MFKRSLFVFAVAMTAASLPVRADDISNRVDALEEQIKQLTGQVEQLTFQLKQMQIQAPKKVGAADPVPLAAPQQQTAAAPAVPMLKKKATVPAPAPQASQGTESIEETSILPPAPAQAEDSAATVTDSSALAQQSDAAAAPAAKVLGAASNRAAQPNDGGFQGQVLVAPGSEDSAASTDTATAQPVSLQPETPDDLFLRSEKALLQLQFGEAEAGFKDFIAKYPTHNLAGSAEFKLGETYYAQQNYPEAARAYMASYKQYPKGRRAPDSLLKLGLSLARIGEKDQACATIGSVDTEFPNAVEVKKRAQSEFKRAGC